MHAATGTIVPIGATVEAVATDVTGSSCRCKEDAILLAIGSKMAAVGQGILGAVQVAAAATIAATTVAMAATIATTVRGTGMVLIAGSKIRTSQDILGGRKQNGQPGLSLRRGTSGVRRNCMRQSALSSGWLRLGDLTSSAVALESLM